MPQVMEVDEDDVRLKFTTQGSSTCICSWPKKISPGCQRMILSAN